MKPTGHPFLPFRSGTFPVLLESGGSFDDDGARTIAAADPFTVLSVRAGVATRFDGVSWRDRAERDSFSALASFIDGVFPRAAIVAGFLSYDAGFEVEHLPSRHATRRVVPEVFFAAYDDFTSWGITPRMAWSRSARQPIAVGRVTSNFSQDDYENAIGCVRALERAGDIYQANLSQMFEAPFRGDPFSLYAKLQEHNPAPFAAYVETPDLAIVCNSPERLVAGDLARGDVESRPIKGTARDEATLAASEKDRAEHLMIVDLVRNDLGRICVAGSVAVEGLGRVVRYPTLCHSVSTVRGRLTSDVGLVDVLRAVFPGGSITGCPKIRAMQIIDGIERAPRGVYCGSVGYVTRSGRFDFNIAIRTAVISGGRVFFGAGGAIVADSIPCAEYDETLLKASAFLRAVGSTRTQNRLFASAKQQPTVARAEH